MTSKLPRISMALCLAATMILALVANIDRDNETINTKPYFSDDGLYYGGGAQSAFVTPHGLELAMVEKLDLFQNAHTMLYNLSGHASHVGDYISQYSPDRYFTSSYLASIVVRMSFGAMSVRTAYIVVNVGLWVASIFFIYRLSCFLFGNPLASLASATLLAGWPLFTLMYQSMKVQYGAVVYLLAGMYLYEYYVDRQPLARQGMFALTFWWIGLNCSGGAAYLLFFLAVRALVRWRDGRWVGVAVIMAMLPVAVFLQGQLLAHYRLQSLLQTFSYGAVLRESLVTLKMAIMGESLEGRKFLSFYGFSYFTVQVPRTALSLWHGNALVVILGIVGLLLRRDRLWLALVAVIALIVGFLPITFIGNPYFYAQFGGPAMVFLILGSGLVLGRVASFRAPAGTIVALAGLIASLWLFMSSYVNALDYFYGGLGYLNQSDHVYVYHGRTLDIY